MKRKRKGIHIAITGCIIIGVFSFLCILAGGYFASRFYGNIRTMVEVEAGGDMASTEDFMVEPWDSIRLQTDISQIDPTSPGVYTLEFDWGPFSKNSTLVVRDSVAPVGTTKDLTGSLQDSFSPEDFVTFAEDKTGVEIYFARNIDYSREGLQEVEIYLEDGGGNRTLLKAELTLYDPDKVPVIEGVQDKYLYAGETVSYRMGVKASSDLDPAPELTIDNSRVDLDTPGTYPVTYTATDCYGRSSSASAWVFVEDKPDNYDDMQQVDRLAEERVEQLILPGMTEIEKAYTLFRWVRRNVPWSNASTVHDEVAETLAALTGRAGDCYTHAMVYKKLLDTAGIANRVVERSSGDGEHFWLLVRIKGEWYHVDPSPVHMAAGVIFLATDSQLEEFDRKYYRHTYYIYDTTRYPATPETSPAVVVYDKGDYILQVIGG